MKNYLDLSGKVALITGGSSGIGAATAAVFAELGATVAIGFNNNEAGAKSVRSRIGGAKAMIVKADMRNPSEIAPMVNQVTEALGPVDILINNAGSLVARYPLQEMTGEAIDEVMDLNFKSAVVCSQAVVPGMRERKSGAIVNVVSIAAHHGGGPGAGLYASAKAALIAFTKSMAKEMAPHGVRVNALSPGVIDTPFHETFSTPEMMANFVKAIPLGRVGRSEECAAAIAFLASEAASYIVGETLEVNGGQLMR
ncbi:MAG TPA: glucose 1-dehydrogenase [Candidatus Limnocylindrales bacterium]|nr:glucose 1-dehydrogenase [Candidatus Limnocylindrales bacterium]